MRFKQRYRYVKSWVHPKTGKTYSKFYRKGWPTVQLHGGMGSEQFEREYNAALHGTSLALAPREARSSPGSVDRVVAQYLDSGSFTELSPLSQEQRRPILGRFRREQGGKLLATIPAQDFKASAAVFRSAHQARHWIKTLRHLMNYAVDMGFCKTNPMEGIKRKAPKSEGYALWREEHIEQFRAHYALGTMERLCLELLLGTGQRISDVQVMGRQHFRGGKLRIKQKKNGVKGMVVDGVEILPELQAALAAMPTSGALTFLLRPSDGQPFQERCGSKWFNDAAKRAGLPPGYTCHGLRKACGTRIAQEGGTAHEVMAVLGHKTLALAEHYTRQFDRAKAAGRAMAKLRAAG